MYDDRIDARFDFGVKIPLRCTNHPAMSGWRTKNIGYIGYRSIFYLGPSLECSCSVSDLRILNESEYEESKKEGN